MSTLFYLAFLAIAAFFVVWLPYTMAERRGRRGWLYVVISLLLTPIVSISVLWVLGRVPGYRRIEE